jgi:hypothetical protein
MDPTDAAGTTEATEATGTQVVQPAEPREPSTIDASPALGAGGGRSWLWSLVIGMLILVAIAATPFPE